MNTKTTFTVTVIALTLGVLFLIFETDLFNRKLSSTPEQSTGAATTTSEGAGKAIPGFEKFKAEEVTRIRVERPGEPTVVIERDDHNWKQVEPIKFPLQPFELDRIVGDAVALVEEEGQGGRPQHPPGGEDELGSEPDLQLPGHEEEQDRGQSEAGNHDRSAGLARKARDLNPAE